MGDTGIETVTPTVSRLPRSIADPQVFDMAQVDDARSRPFGTVQEPCVLPALPRSGREQGSTNRGSGRVCAALADLVVNLSVGVSAEWVR